MGMHPLHAALIAAANGQFLARDGRVEVYRPDVDEQQAVVEFTAHAFVLTDRDPDEVLARGANGLGGASSPDLLRWLAGSDSWIGGHDVVLVTPGTGGGSLPERNDLDDHPRVLRSREHRRDVRVYGDETGLVTIGRGLVDRLELAVELLVQSEQRGGSGLRLIEAARALVPAGDLLWAQVAPGNAASLRAFLRSGFVPVGAETLIGLPKTDI